MTEEPISQINSYIKFKVFLFSLINKRVQQKRKGEKEKDNLLR